MNCSYSFYDKNEKYYPKLYCSIDNKMCILSKRCEKLQKFIPLEGNYKECYKIVEQRKKNIPNGSKYIEFERNGYLYVDIDDTHTVKIKNSLGEINQNYIYVKEGIDGYEISLVPFEETKRTYTRKK